MPSEEPARVHAAAYELSIKFDPSEHAAQIQSETLRADGVAHIDRHDARPESTLANPERWSNADSRNIVEHVRRALMGVHKYHFVPHQLKVPSALTVERQFRMDFDGFGLPSCLNDVLNYDAKLFIRLTEQFCKLFPGFENLRLRTQRSFVRRYLPDGAYVIETAAGYEIVFATVFGKEIRAVQASDGVLLVLAFLALKSLPNPPATILLEEPENGLHPHRLRELVSFLRQMAWSLENPGGPQIIMSTHSPYLLDELEPEEVTVFLRDPGQTTKVYPLKTAPGLKDRLRGFLLGEVLFNVGEKEIVGQG